MWYIYTMEYYSAFKKNEVMMSFAGAWMGLEIVILREVRQRRRNIIGHPLYVESKKKSIICNLFTKLKETQGLSKLMAANGRKLGGCGGRGEGEE